MSYLTTLARPVESTPRTTAPRAHVPAAEPFVEVHREVEAAPPRAALRAPTSTIDRPPGQAASIPHEGPARLPVSPHVSPAVDERKPASIPVVEYRSVPAAADRPESTLEVLSPHETASIVQPRASVPSSALPMPPARVSHEANRTSRRDDHDEAAREREHPPERAATRLPVLPLGHSDETAGRTTAAPGRGKMNVNIGAISLTVKAPTVASPPASPVIAPAAQALPSAAPSRSREGLAFSASRHYLRWN